MRRAALTAAAVIMAGTALTAGSAPTASAAASTQRICSSKYSESPFAVYSATHYWRVKKTECYTVPKGSTVQIVFDSYRVGYNLGPYSDCRPGARSFVPYQKADTIYFRTYIDSNC